MSLRQRLARLERASPVAAYEADAAEFERIIARLAERMPPLDADELRQAQAIGREMLRSYPGCANMFANMSLDDYRA